MIDNANRIVCDSTLQADICIVGGGAAGIAMAMRLMQSGLSVLLLESGGPRHDAETHALYAGEVVDPTLHSPPDTYRQRRFGGSTTIWGGRCVPFDPIDLETRPWIEHASWPISYDALEAFYPDANALCEAGAWEYDARAAVAGGMRPMIRGFLPCNFDVNRIERFSCPTDFARRYGNRLRDAGNLRVLTHANVTHIAASADGSRVDHVLVRTLHGNRFFVRANQFVLATGGIEVTRLLLASRDVHTNGIGNAEDLLGRYYMCHIAGTVGALRIDLPREAVWHGYDVAEDGTYCRRRIALRPDRQREHGIGNIVFRLHHPRIPDPAHGTGALSAIYLAKNLISYEYAKRLAGEEDGGVELWLRHARNLVADPFATAWFLAHWVRYRILAQRKFPSVIIRPRVNLFSLDFHAEQAPNRASRITLGDGIDRFGMPPVRIDWRYLPTDVRTVSVAFELLQREFARTGIGTLALATGEPDIETVIRRDGAYGGHHLGTARMGASPAMGVVDSDCRVWGVNNLYIAGGAVFPTSSQANPTLTIVALALRLADHLKKQASQPIVATGHDTRADEPAPAEA
ncbi:MAG: FAD-dependent oxidoreductase [Acetobacteraceae bacterium]